MKEKPCKICGKMFVPDCPSNKICKDVHYAKCPICNKDIIWNSTRVVEPCSKECRKELTKRKNIAKYGVEHPMQSKEVQANHKQAMLEKYGVESPLQSKEIKQRAIESNRKKFGVDWALSSKTVKEKARITMIERYGAPTTLESTLLREKVEQTCLEKYGVSNIAQYKDSSTKLTNANFLSYAAKHTKVFPYLSIMDIFMSKLDERGIDSTCCFRLGDMNYDIKLIDNPVLIEIDNTLIHNSIIKDRRLEKGVSNYWHKLKTQVANDNGYRCIHVFDWDDWDSIINLIAPKKPIYARNCTIYKLQSKVADEFLNKYHLQGTVKGQTLCLGLVHEGELLQVMTFGKPRYNQNYYCELLRLCTKPGIALVGGANKLFKYATKTMGLEEIISYCDLSKFNGDVYERIGMKLKTITEPQEIWSKDDKKITANLLRQRGYDQLFNANYGKGTSNEQLMLEHGWLPVYDCGQAVYIY